VSDQLPVVVIVGGGFGGLAAAKALKNAPVQVVLGAAPRETAGAAEDQRRRGYGTHVDRARVRRHPYGCSED
jgi:cation diffusion facilitator CzcD-associated flavoprotein CzcO